MFGFFFKEYFLAGGFIFQWRGVAIFCGESFIFSNVSNDSCLSNNCQIFPMLFYKRNILMAVFYIWNFFKESFLGRGGFIFQWRGGSFFCEESFIFGCGVPHGRGICFDGGVSQKVHGVGKAPMS